MKKVLIYPIVVCLLAACSSMHPKEAPAPKAANAPMPITQKPTQSETAPAASQAIEVNPLTDPNNILSKRNIYFDLDKYNVKPEYRPLVEAHAKYLAQHPKADVVLEGNADERGSREYNLALGQKRAIAVKQTLSVLGVADAQVETISYGKEKPKALGHDESSWAENRRTDIRYAGE